MISYYFIGMILFLFVIELLELDIIVISSLLAINVWFNYIWLFQYLLLWIKLGAYIISPVRSAIQKCRKKPNSMSSIWNRPARNASTSSPPNCASVWRRPTKRPQENRFHPKRTNACHWFLINFRPGPNATTIQNGLF